MEFSELTLHPDLHHGIAEAGYVTCMPVQEQVLANAFGGHDLYVQSQTGTGKTAAFLIVIFQRLLTEPMLKGKKALIMVPTRELAVQVEDEANRLGKFLPFKTGSFYGGVGYTQQQKMLREDAQILVGTPGRVLDLNGSGYMNLMDLAFLVLDEADRMFDMGFYPDLRKLIKVVPPIDRRQTMLFSATLNNWVKNLAWEYTKEPVEIEIAPENVTVDEIEQRLYHVPSSNKTRLLLGILEQEQPESAIIFCNTKRYTEITAKRLRLNGYDCEFIIGDLPQSKRLKIIEDIKAGKIRFLVATDVAARGLDIEDLSLVVNFDLPVETENYVHRIGRTARAGKTGKAITLASEQDVYELPAIEKYIGKKIPAQIATEELYREDKSEGMRIYTDSYDDRRDSRRGGRGQPHRKGPERGQSFKEYDRNASGRNNRPKYAEDDKPRRRKPGNIREENQGIAEKPAPEPRPNLSKLSLEERMAYYKQKYDTPKKGRTEAPHRSRAPQRGQSRNSDRSLQKRSSGKKSNSKSSVPVSSSVPPAKTGSTPSTKPRSPAPAPKKAASGGIVYRILGIFKRKS
ncbi:MAG: DEAD/DEAH box helicase [Spirochaetaceae bacterium]|jgi:ATP-dependent RNA helicase RhlB|nr:DEAD/DEAH box helicase [Spirochaetaceae bacterium]